MLQDSTVRKLLPMVNNKQNEERIAAYVSDRVSYLYKQLEQCTTAEDMRLLQGAIKEVRRLDTLRDEVAQRAKEI
jgi:hypothetical protein